MSAGRIPEFEKKRDFVIAQVKHHMGDTVKVLQFHEKKTRWHHNYYATLKNRKGQIYSVMVDAGSGEVWQ